MLGHYIYSELLSRPPQCSTFIRPNSSWSPRWQWYIVEGTGIYIITCKVLSVLIWMSFITTLIKSMIYINLKNSNGPLGGFLFPSS